MKFLGQPNLVLINRKTNKVIGKFDENGIIDITDEKLIPRMSRYKKAENVCNKCGMAFDSKGKLLNHYRKEHKDDSAGSI